MGIENQQISGALLLIMGRLCGGMERMTLAG
jgi:hypothetical protein